MNTWKVVPLHKDQLKDVDPNDVIYNGHFRICNTYKGGGGYDLFPHIATNIGLAPHPDEVNKQFVVQLYGCNLDCPYCYVTRAGVWSKPVLYTTDDLIDAYLWALNIHGTKVFHLMGGASGIYISKWHEILDELPYYSIFHSDLMLTEKLYNEAILENLARRNVLLAINIKGISQDEYKANTRKELNESMFYSNLHRIEQYLKPDNYYFTFTNVDSFEVSIFMTRVRNKRHYIIDLKDYNALPYVDNMPWGGIRDSRRN